MRWPVALVFAYVLLGLELVLPRELRLGAAAVAPSLVIPFVIFIAMHASPARAYWFALLLGLTLDLLTPYEGRLVVPGPHALGLAAAVFLVVTIRTIITRNLIGLIVFSILGAALSQLVVVALLTFRSMYSAPTAWQPRQELIDRFFSSLYTGATAAVLGLILLSCAPLFHFNDPYARRGAGRISVVRSRRP